jgi:hypothetical protein
MLLVPLFALLASPGWAQVCAGLPSLSDRPIIASADLARAKTGWSATAGVTAGRRLFGAVYGGTTTYEDVEFAAQIKNASSFLAGAGIGYEVTLARDPETAGADIGLCPLFAAEWESGPDGDFGATKLDGDGWTVSAGASVGGLLFDRMPWRLIPFAAASFARVSTTVHDFPFVGTDTDARDDGWLFAFGVGIGIGPQVTVSPGFTIPTGITGGENSFSLGVNVGFGHAR